MRARVSGNRCKQDNALLFIRAIVLFVIFKFIFLFAFISILLNEVFKVVLRFPFIGLGINLLNGSVALTNNNNNNNNNNNGLYFTQDKDTYPMLQLFMNTVKHNKANKLIIES